MVYRGYDYNLVWFVNLLKTKRPTLESPNANQLVMAQWQLVTLYAWQIGR